MKALLNRAVLWTLTLAGIAWSPALAHAQVRYGSIVVEGDPSERGPGRRRHHHRNRHESQPQRRHQQRRRRHVRDDPAGHLLGPRQPDRLRSSSRPMSRSPKTR